VQIEDEAWEGLSSLPESQQDKVFAFNKNHLQHHPTQPIPGHLKRLKGDFSGFSIRNHPITPHDLHRR
jgi:hypothetical protein